MRLALAVAAALAIGACSGMPTTPPASPGGFGDVIGELVLHGVTVHEHTSGDDGCPNVELHDNAAHLSASFGSMSRLFDIYVFRWRRASDFEAEAVAFADCLEGHRALRPGSQVVALESSPWRAYGTDWPPDLRLVVEEALFGAGGQVN
jgi:hypothetical protein